MSSCHVSEVIKYWESHHSDGCNYGIQIMNKRNILLARNDNTLPFLLDINSKYPDAPDILYWLAEEYEKDREYLKALQIYIKLINLYPDIDLYSKGINICKAYIEADSMPDTKDTLNWLKQRIIEIWK